MDQIDAIPELEGLDLLDTLLQTGTTRSDLTYESHLAVILVLVQNVLDAYHTRQVHPDVFMCLGDVIALGDPTLSLATLLFLVHSAPQTINILLRYSHCQSTSQEYLAWLARKCATCVACCGDGTWDPHAFVVECRRRWAER